MRVAGNVLPRAPRFCSSRSRTLLEADDSASFWTVKPSSECLSEHRIRIWTVRTCGDKIKFGAYAYQGVAWVFISVSLDTESLVGKSQLGYDKARVSSGLQWLTRPRFPQVSIYRSAWVRGSISVPWALTAPKSARGSIARLTNYCTREWMVVLCSYRMKT